MDSVLQEIKIIGLERSRYERISLNTFRKSDIAGEYFKFRGIDVYISTYELKYRQITEAIDLYCENNRVPDVYQYDRVLKESKQNFIDYEELKLKKKLAKYENKVRAMTELQDFRLLPNFEKRGKEYHLDHIVPISVGFDLQLPQRLIYSINNLQIIHHKQNMRKGCRVHESIIDHIHELHSRGEFPKYAINKILKYKKVAIVSDRFEWKKSYFN